MWFQLMLSLVVALILVGLLVLKVHTISLAITMGLGSIIIFALWYLVGVMVRLFQLFWASLEVE